MDASPGLIVGAADDAALWQVQAGPAPARPPQAVRSLRVFVEEAVAKAETHAIGRALTAAKGNKSLAARILRTNYTTLHAKMKRFKISAHEFRPS
jgi:transcriptional regulator with GAF, ATPase, and Fis domain